MKSIQLLAAAMLFAGVSGSVYADENGGFSKNQICRVGIAKIMGRNPSIIKIDHMASDVIYLSYVRQDDQTKWKYKCKIEGNRIIWGSDTGRWRMHPMDAKVSFKVSGNSISVNDAFSDGSSSNKTYSLEQVSN